MITFIYILQDPITLEVRYVGKTNNPDRRKRSHLWRYDKNKSYCYKWVNSLLKKDLKPIFTVIDSTNNEWEWLEKYWIEQFKTWGCKLTNITFGGEGSYGGAEWNNRPVTIFDLKGKLVKSFESQKECAVYLNTSTSNVKQCAVGRNKLLLKKYQLKNGILLNDISRFEYKRNYIKTGKSWSNTKKIKCIDDGLVFQSLKDASIFYNISVGVISSVLTKRTKKTKNGKSFIYE